VNGPLKLISYLKFFFAAFPQLFNEPQQQEPLLFREEPGGLFHCGCVFLKDLGDEPAAFRGEFDQAHAPVVGIPPFHKPLPLQPIDRDTNRSGCEPYFGTNGVDRQGALVEQH
jgi:hypothetical protein